MRRSAAELLLVLLSGGCDVEGSVGLAFDPKAVELTWAELSFTPRRDLDLLFVIDNSAGMRPKQEALKQALGGFAAGLDRLGSRHFHFAVVTTDLGAGKAVGACVAPGDDGLLMPLGRAAPDGCLGPVDARFLDLDQTGADNLPTEHDLAQTLGCMISAGDQGCGFEQPLEAMRRALSGNSGFLRPEALLVIVFLTDEDDCSGPPDSPVYDPTSQELGPYSGFRCITAGVQCGNPPHPPGAGEALDDCVPSEGNALYSLSRYRDLLFRTTGLKRNPNDVKLVVIAAPPVPFSVAPDRSGLSMIEPSCVAADGLSGSPSLRLQALAAMSPVSVVASLCTPGASEYALGTLIPSLNTAVPCLPAPIANSAQPDCEVEADGQKIPSCVASEGAIPCWELITRSECLPVYSQHSRGNEQLALNLRPAVSPGALVTARCLVVDARK